MPAPANLPVGGTTGLCHEATAAIEEAAAWLAADPLNRLHNPIVPLLRERFGLSFAEATAAVKEAQQRREGGNGEA